MIKTVKRLVAYLGILCLTVLSVQAQIYEDYLQPEPKVEKDYTPLYYLILAIVVFVVWKGHKLERERQLCKDEEKFGKGRQ